MQRAIAFCAVAALLLVSSVAFAANDGEPAQYFGHAYVDLATGNVTWGTGDPAPSVGIDVYSNTTSSGLFAVSSTDLASIWGDRVTTTGLGTLSQFDMTLFNSGSSAGSLLTCSVQILFYDGATNAFIGGFNGNINFGAGLSPGFFSVVTFSNLETLATPVVLGTNDVIVTQTRTSHSGAANRLGIVSMGPITIGSSASSMYISSATVGGGSPGFYTFANGPADPGYRINTDQVVATENSTWGKVKALYR